MRGKSNLTFDLSIVLPRVMTALHASCRGTSRAGDPPPLHRVMELRRPLHRFHLAGQREDEGGGGGGGGSGGGEL